MNCACDFCDKTAVYDCNIVLLGCWANVCETHFNQFGCKLGLGLGQKLETEAK